MADGTKSETQRLADLVTVQATNFFIGDSEFHISLAGKSAPLKVEATIADVEVLDLLIRQLSDWREQLYGKMPRKRDIPPYIPE